ncbi:MAG: urease accessory protein UreF [Rhodobacteraceae bacterium]|nr:urease accessory protein UreF [Paracoccaceae bacterium]
MPTDPRLLTLAQWLSPAYPTGAFAWSHGLEAAIAAGWVRDAGGLGDWLADLLAEGSGRAEAVWIGLGFRAADGRALRAVDARARAWAPAAERLREADRQGAAFAAVTRAVWGIDLPDCLLPVALGRAARLMAMDPGDVAALHLQGFAANLVAAAQRLMPLGQTAAQAVLARLAPLCLAAADLARAPDEAALFSNAFLSDVAAMRHETLQARLFQS